MDRPRPTTHHPKVKWHHKSTIPPLPIISPMRNCHFSKSATSTIRQHPSPVPWLLWCLWTAKRKRITPITPMGSHNWTKTWGPHNSHKQNHSTLASQTTGTLPIPKRTHHTRNNMPIKKPICHIILLHQKEEQQTLTSARLSTSKLINCQKPLPPTPYTITNWPTTWLHPIYWIWYRMGIQWGSHQRERPLEGSIHNQWRPVQTNSHVLRLDQLPGHIPNNDKHHLLRSHWWRECNHLHGWHSHPH